MPSDNNSPENPPRVEEPAQPAYQRDYAPGQPDDPALVGFRSADSLQKAKFTPEQAESVVLTVRELAGDLATKSDLTTLRNELKVELAEFKSEIKVEFAEFKSEIKTEIAGLRSETAAEFAAVRSETAAEFAAVRSEIKSATAALGSDLRTEMKEMETRLEKSINKSILWAAGIAVVTFLAGIGIAATFIVNHMSRLLGG